MGQGLQAGNRCFDCDLGQYSPGGTLTDPKPPCSRCPSGLTTTIYAAISVDDCVREWGLGHGGQQTLAQAGCSPCLSGA